MDWWRKKPYRMVQNNLRDIDGAMDVDYEVEMLKALGANVVQVGCGGISAYGPSKLACQRPTPYLQGDKFGEIVEKCHVADIRVIARFDISKVHKEYLATNPDWFTRRADGSPAYFEDCAAVCVNGAYQQERILDILREAMTNYSLDGIFFNIPGYVTTDYDGNYVGICQCENCKRRFHEWSGGMALPLAEDDTDPTYRKYEEFKRYTVADMLHKVRSLVKSIDPDVALSTYSDDGIDIVRCEAQSAINAKHFWLYSGSEDSAAIKTTFPDKVPSNCAINAVDIPYRFMGVSTWLNQIRLYQNVAVGGNLDWCIIGAFEDYPDRANFKGVSEAFHLHAQHEKLFSRLQTTARILLINPRPFYQFSTGLMYNEKEYRGIVHMLKEQHIPFDTVILSAIEDFTDRLNNYDIIVIPDLPRAPGPKLREALLTTTATVVGTGHTFREDPALLDRLFGVRILEKIEPVTASYLLTQPKEVFRSFPERDWVFLHMDSNRIVLTNAEGYLPLVAAAPYGPPERAHGHVLTNDPMAAVKEGKNLYLPWLAGTLYYNLGYEDHKNIFLDLLDKVRPLQQPFTTDAPGCVDVFCHSIGQNTYLVQLINLSGFNGVTMAKPLPMENIHLTLSGKHPETVELLTAEGFEHRPVTGDTLTLPCTGCYAGYRITCK